MTKIEDDLGTNTPADLSPEPIEILIPEVRQRTRLRRLRNFAVVLAVVALVVGVIAITGSGSPSTQRIGSPTSPSSPTSTFAKILNIAPKQPGSLAVGPNGELYVADHGRQQILRRLPNGHFDVVVGTGVAGYSGDGGRAIQAKINNPGRLAIAPNGALYFTQSGRLKVAGGMTNTVVREVTPNGKITTVIGQDPNCAVVPSNSNSVPAKSAEFTGASLTIGSNGLLDISTTVCPNVRNLGSFLQLTSSGELVQTPVDATPYTSGYCGPSVAGPGFVVFGCGSGGGRDPRLMVVQSNGTTADYPNFGSQPDLMSASNGIVVAIHNRAVVRVGTNGLETIATPRQIADLVSRAALAMGTLESRLTATETSTSTKIFWSAVAVALPSS